RGTGGPRSGNGQRYEEEHCPSSLFIIVVIIISFILLLIAALRRVPSRLLPLSSISAPLFIVLRPTLAIVVFLFAVPPLSVPGVCSVIVALMGEHGARSRPQKQEPAQANNANNILTHTCSPFAENH